MMLTNDDWNRALDTAVAAERERLGGPPTPEDVVAFKRGQLPEADAARVRALLVYYPELTPLLDDAPAPHDYRRLLPIAASVLLTFLVPFAMYTQWRVARLERESRTPIVHQARQELSAFVSRGVPAPPFDLAAGEGRFLLTLMLSDRSRHRAAYRLQIVDASARPKVVWTARDVRPIDGAFEVSISREFLKRGSYRIDVYGDEEIVESFPFRVR